MTSVRVRTCVTGAALAVVAGALVVHGAVFGADFLKTAVLGLAAGAALGLVQTRSAPERAGAFVLGVLAAWLGYALRAGVLPDIPMGRALAVVAVVSLVTAVATASADRLPLWSGLLGVAVLFGAYEAVYTAAPAEFMAESVMAATSVLLAAAFGFLVVATVPALVVTTTSTAPTTPTTTTPTSGSGVRRPSRRRPVEAGSDVSLDSLLAVPAPRATSTDVPASSTTPSATTPTESER